MSACPLANLAHDEQWARMAITRSLRRKEAGWRMSWCDDCEAWHVWNPMTEEVL